MADGNIVQCLEVEQLVFLHDPAGQFLTGFHAFHGDDADAVAVLMHHELYGHTCLLVLYRNRGRHMFILYKMSYIRLSSLRFAPTVCRA